MTTVAMLLILATVSFAQKARVTPLGEWKGESLCTVKPSACHDEVVVYDITAAADKDHLVWSADKVVNGERQNMGSLDCTFAESASVVTCDLPGKGVWSFTLHGDTMTGTLKLSDGTLFRKVNVKRSK